MMKKGIQFAFGVLLALVSVGIAVGAVSWSYQFGQLSAMILEPPPAPAAPRFSEALSVNVTPPQPAVVWLEGGGWAGDLAPPQNRIIVCEAQALYVVQLLDHVEFRACGPGFPLAQYIKKTKRQLGVGWDSPYLIAVESQYFGVTDGDGHIKFRGMQPGVYMLHAWSPFQGEVRKGIVVPGPGYEIDFALDRSWVTYNDPAEDTDTALMPIR